MDKHPFPFRLPFNGQASQENIVQIGHYRFTLLTPQLIRLEYSESGGFCDQPTQTVWNRQLQSVKHDVSRQESLVVIETDSVILKLADPSHFNHQAGEIRLKGNIDTVWHFGDTASNLKSTARTLDLKSGSTPLDDGVISHSGIAILDDGASLLLNQFGWVEPDSGERIDLYCFAYGHDYKSAVRDYYRISGPLPLVPRYVLGNWWSKYWPYRDKDLLDVVSQFQIMDIPLSVLVVDMDWHITSIVGQQDYWKGWTGYTVNKSFFPDFAGFLEAIHQHGLKISLNLHPADGVKPYEDQYAKFAKSLGLDPLKKETIPFDSTDPRFMASYFQTLLHPYETLGVDLWWVDWQQGTQTAIDGLDPLWMLNHTHFLDSGKDPSKRPLTFSRWTNRGGQRYPIGFSGDAVISWKTLQYQPYFTATAANLGFTLWSHDIGGHDDGIEDPELYCRWIQWGVFSPILRLHSARNQFTVREPWRHKTEIRTIVRDLLRFRHQLIPYLYTIFARNAFEGIPALCPVYYLDPEASAAYRHRNAYLLGDSLYVDPVVSPLDNHTNRSRIDTWIPEGTWTDLNTLEVFHGKKTFPRYLSLEQQNVYARAGAIIPLNDGLNLSADKNPEKLVLWIFPTADGNFVLYEDDCLSQGYQSGDFFQTRFELTVTDDKVRFSISPDKEPKSYIPKNRDYTLFFANIQYQQQTLHSEAHESGIHFHVSLASTERFTVEFSYVRRPENRAILKSLESFLVDLPASPSFKKDVYDAFVSGKSKAKIRSHYQDAPVKVQSVLNQFLRRFQSTK